MRAYELMVIFDGDLDDASVSAAYNGVQTEISAVATIAKADFWGKRRFAYEIGHRTDGYYAVIEILAEGGRLDPVERSLRLADPIVRHKLIRLPDDEAARRGLGEGAEQAAPAG
jgi:small subunit ribosomal protein S6